MLTLIFFMMRTLYRHISQPEVVNMSPKGFCSSYTTPVCQNCNVLFIKNDPYSYYLFVVSYI